MAKTKMGMWMTDARGKSGGHVITQNRQGQAVRTKKTPINRRTTAQQNQRASFTANSQGWRDLSASERLSWDSAAQDFKKTNIFGDSYSPTGKNLYMLINQNISLAGGTAVTSPPANDPPTDLTAFAIASNTTSAMTVSFAASPVATGNTVVLYGTRPLSAGIGSAGANYRKFSTIAAAGTTPANIFSAYQTKFGTPVSGKKIFIKAIVINKTSGVRGGSHEANSITA